MAYRWLLLALTVAAAGCGGSYNSHPEEGCIRMEEFFARDVYGKVFQENCLGCHAPQGLAATSRLVFATPATDEDYLAHDLEQLTPLGRESVEVDGKPASLLVAKALGQVSHAGGQVIDPASPEAQYLRDFVTRLDQPVACENDPPADPFAGFVYRDPQSLLRKTTLNLVGRLPTDEERAAVEQGGEGAIPALVDQMFSEPAFNERLEEAWGDLFMTADASTPYEAANGLDDVAYPDAHWYDALPEPDLGTGRAGVSYGMSREGIELVSYLVRNDLPMTQVLTADFVMVNPYTAKSYGIFAGLSFVDPTDREEFVPAHLPRIGDLDVGGDNLPHAGVLTTYSWLGRTPSTRTNRNRARARVFEKQFLDTDVLEIAPRADPLAADGFENPPMQAPQCTVCHATVDPIAGAFQDFGDSGQWDPRSQGWYDDMFAPGFGDAPLPAADTHRGLAWLAQEAAQDPRFVRAMVAQAFRMVIGHEPLPAPDAQGPDYLARLRAYEAQRAVFHDLGEAFVASNYSWKTLVKGMLTTPYFRARNVDPTTITPAREPELALIFTNRLLAPEQLARKVHAIFGIDWMRGTTDLLRSRTGYRLLYGGMDSKEITERLEETNPVMANLQKTLGNYLGCHTVAADFTLPVAERRFFGGVEITDLSSVPASKDKILATIVALHGTILGETITADGPEAQATLALWDSVQSQGKAAITAGTQVARMEGRCSTSTLRDDPDYTVRAWMAVITYLTSTHAFLYE